MERTPRLAPQYEPHTEPRPCYMIRRKGARPPSFLFRTNPDCQIGCIAQLVEHWAFNLMVAGSSPAIPKKKTTLVFVRMHSSLKRALSGLETRPFLINISTSLVVIVSIMDLRLARSSIGRPSPYSLDRARGRVKSSTS